MKNKFLFLVPFLVMSVSACANVQNTTNSGSNGTIESNGNGNNDLPPGPGGYVKDVWTDFNGETLPLGTGNKLVGGPENLNNPIDIANGYKVNLYSEIPANWVMIMGNNKVSNNNANFYPKNNGYGFKFNNEYSGLQSFAFNSWKYIDVSLLISDVEAAKSKYKTTKEILHIYGYNTEGKPIVQKFIEQGSITKQSIGTKINITIKNDEVCYLEFRLNEKPLVGQQYYNFGVKEIEFKGRN